MTRSNRDQPTLSTETSRAPQGTQGTQSTQSTQSTHQTEATGRVMPGDASAYQAPDTRRTLRQILSADECLVAASVFDAASARLARHIGAEVGVLGGSAAAQVVLGVPDIVLLTASDLVEQSRRICRTGCVHLIVDADHGYGNALNVMRTISDLQAAGVAATCLEDSRLPKEHGSGPQQALVSMEEGCQKMRAALHARGDGPMLILGRTNAIDSTGIDDAIARLQAYESVGVDALFVPYLKQRDDLERIASAVRSTLVVAGAHASLFDPAWLAQMGVRVWMWGHQPLAVATAELLRAMQSAQNGMPASELLNEDARRASKLATASQAYEGLTDQFLR
ncbi:isocitrate lyase/PEP mutase family protein [Orrella marina]|nr:isocitrate lyase/PEP mutase family protein [Orrella marina]